MAQQDQELSVTYHNAVQEQEQEQQRSQPSHYDFGIGTAVSNNNVSENKWNKNGFGQGVPIRTGKYTKEETETIKNAVRDYCALKQITVTRLCSECDHKADLKGSWMEIAKCLPHRSVQSVYRHGLRQLHPFKRGVWSDEDVELLIGLVAQVGKKWAHIQSKLNRSADACRDKYRELDDSFVRGRWKDGETEQLKALIREYLGVDPRAEMRELGKMVEGEHIRIPWSTMSKRMGNRSRLSCFKKWQKMTGLFSPSDIPRFEGGGSNTTTSSSRDANHQQQQQHQHQQQQHIHTSTVNVSQIEGAILSTATNDMTVEGALGVDLKTHVVGKESSHIPIIEEPGDTDVYLLSELVSLDYVKASDVCWDEFRFENAEERWYELLEEWQSTIMDDSMLALPVSDIAQRILDQKTSAQRAAETVEAVDLPDHSLLV
mmetsp:Transcript_10746/g.21255  ORF Transcript_10746/g.21255 Transcript_10746/m.21255 type:complete len:431 (-) Transcript_10746:412-1704(-)